MHIINLPAHIVSLSSNTTGAEEPFLLTLQCWKGKSSSLSPGVQQQGYEKRKNFLGNEDVHRRAVYHPSFLSLAGTYLVRSEPALILCTVHTNLFEPRQ